MPFDFIKKFTPTKSEPEPTPDIFTLDAVIAWAEKQSPEQEYNWASSHTCFWGLYARAHGISYGDVCEGFGQTYEINGKWLRAEPYSLYYHVASLRPQTIGGILKRLRELRAESVT